MADQKDYPLHIYNDKQASSYIAGAAYHNYGGHYDELQKIHLAQPDKELIFTETSIGEWNDGRNLSARLLDDMEHIGIGILNNWGKAVIVWNLMLDEKGAPNREGGCKTCYGAVDISSSDYKTITKNSHYYVIGHLASVIKPNAIRIQSETSKKNILCTSFKNPDGSYALVLLNRASSDEEITINDGKKHFKYSIPARSVASFFME
ncbi:glycoside hydrolase family 30 beta sandwich domain-containing protein [Capnocytophaga canimorsus]|nr:glycoside hydrolase family 30 beta sandwich domain-containing protein [Capnocytophaga canimorsus]WGU68049.1 glycoside hydrolase family 30 beta sandwich domain-containing protein [Capnocytophaga canimorsus]